MQVINSEYLMKIVITYYCKDINGDVLINGDKYNNVCETNQIHPIYKNGSMPRIAFPSVNLQVNKNQDNKIENQQAEADDDNEVDNGEIKILNDIIEDEPISRIARRGRPAKLTAEQRKQNIHNSQIEYHRKRYQDDEEYRERLKQRGRDKYKELKSNKPLKDLTVEEHKVLKKAHNDKYREKKNC